MSNLRKVGWNVLYLGGSNVVSFGAALVFTVLCTRALGIDLFATMGIVLSLITFLEAIVRGGVSTVLTRRVAQDHRNASIYWWPSIAMHLGFGLFFIVGGTLGSLALGGDRLMVAGIAVASFVSAIRLLGESAVGILRGMDRIGPEFRATLVERALFMAMFFVILHRGSSLDGGFPPAGVIAIFGANVLSQLVQTGWIILPLWLRLRPAFRLERGPLLDLYHASSILWLIGFMISLHWRIDSFLVKRLSTDEAMGAFYAAFKLPDMARIIPWLLCMAIFPLLSRQVKESVESFRATYAFVMKLLLLLSIPCMGIMILSAPAWIGLMSDDFRLATRPLVVMSLATPMMFVNGLFNYGALASDRNDLLVRAYGITVAIQALAGFILIPGFRQDGAALSFLIAETALLSMSLYGASRHLASLHLSYYSGSLLTLGAVGLTTAYFYGRSLPIGLACVCAVTVGGVVAFRAFTSQEADRIRSVLVGGRSVDG